MATKTLDWTNAQALFPALLECAHHGSATVITKHGTPYAALMPASAATTDRRRVSVLALAGTGIGLWSDASARSMNQIRDEWA